MCGSTVYSENIMLFSLFFQRQYLGILWAGSRSSEELMQENYTSRKDASKIEICVLLGYYAT
jgi:hypothetical protein